MKKYVTLITYLIFSAVFIQTTFAGDITITTNTTWDSETYTYDNVLITNSATLTFNGAVTLNAHNLTIDSGSSISADGKGYPATQGPGAGTWVGGGGGYGGKGGGPTGGSTYGSAKTPTDLGSGGGNGYGGWYPGFGGAGAGAIRLNIFGTLTLNGTISSNGESTLGMGGGGSGGSIYITTATLTGTDQISANGGNSGEGTSVKGYGGGGGRIAVYYGTSTFTSKVEAKGGSGYLTGENGTIGLFDTLNNSLHIYQGFDFKNTEGPFNFNDVNLWNGARVSTDENISLAANNLNISEGSVLTLGPSCTVDVSQGIMITGSGSTITHTQGNSEVNIRAHNLTIDSGSSISANSKGYGPETGPGAGTWVGGGGGYGGKGGGPTGGSTYGSAKTPTDLGSGGGNGYGGWYPGFGGAGAGAIRLNIFGTLTLNGTISSNGESTLGMGGGGSGGSIYITTATLTGTDQISANGGNSGEGTSVKGYGGGGGRIAVYYGTSTFTGKVEAKGGIGGLNGEDGTVVFQGPSLDAPVTYFNLVEKSFTTSTSSEILSSQAATLDNITVTGDLNGAINFINFEIVKIETGSFKGEGFSTGEFEANLAGTLYKGKWQGVSYFIPSEKKIYLKGEISGDISGISDGYLSESIPGSGNYDKYQATWKISRLGKDYISLNINLEGTISYRSSSTFTSELYLYQANMEGSAFGYYTGPLSAVVTHLRLTSENEYKGQGFSIISYNSSLGQGEGWAYNYLSATNIIAFQGLFKEPILGKLSAILDENKSPKTLSGTIERMDVGLEAMADLEVITWGPQRVSPGQTIDYLIEVRNDGLKNAENTSVIFALDPLLEYVSSTYSYLNDETNEIIMDLGMLEAKGKKIIRVTARVPWGLEPHTFLENSVGISTTTKEKDLSGVDTTSWREGENIHPADIILEHNENSEVWRNPLIKSYWSHGGGIVYGTKDDWWTGGKDGYFVIEPLPEDKHHNNLGGVRVTPIEFWDYPFKKEVVVLRVGNLTQEQKDYIANFWKRQIGKPYESLFKLVFTPKDRDINAPSWYCSELIWAPYFNLGIDLDAPGLDYYDPAIAPSEIYDSNLISHVLGGYFNYKNLNINIHITSSEVLTAHDPNIKYGPEGDVLPGQKLNYKVEYANEGEGIAYGVYFTDTLDEDLDDSTLKIGPVIDVKTGVQIAPIGTYNPQTRTITWLVGEVGSGQGGYAEFSINVRNDASDGTEIINFATVYFPSVPEATRTNGVVNKVTTVIDKTAPTTTISISPSPNPAGWNNTNVDITLSAVDNEGGSGVAKTEYTFDDINWLTYNNPFTITAEGTTTIYYKSTDNANNVESQHTLIVKIDKTPPEVLISTPQDGAEYTLKEQIPAAWLVTDFPSGVALVSATTPQGEPIDTTSIGLKTFKVSSVDNAGNNIEKTYTYYVRYNFGGILPPINQDGSSIFKLGRVVPVKFQLKDAIGNYISTAVARIYLTKVSNNVTGSEIEAESVGEANTGNLFRYSGTDNQYIFNLGTTYLSEGTWQIRISLDDGTSKYVNIALK